MLTSLCNPPCSKLSLITAMSDSSLNKPPPLSGTPQPKALDFGRENTPQNVRRYPPPSPLRCASNVRLSLLSKHEDQSLEAFPRSCLSYTMERRGLHSSTARGSPGCSLYNFVECTR